MKEKVSKKDVSPTKTKARSLTGKRGKAAPTKFLPGKAPSSIFTSSKALPPHSTSLASTTKQVDATQCEEITIVEPVSTQTSSVWPADGILRQALMSYSYPHQTNEKQPESHADSVLEISSDSVEVLELTQEDSIPIDSLSDKMGTISCDLQTTAISTYTVSLTTDAPCTRLTSLLLSDSVPRSSQVLQNATPASRLLSTVDGDGETFVSIPVVLMSSGDRLVPTTSLSSIALGQTSETSDGKFCTLVTDVGRMEPSDTSSAPTEDGFVTVVYSTVPDATAAATKFHGQKLPLPPMSDLKSKRTNRLVPASKKTFRTSEINRIIGVNNSAVPRIIASADATSVDFGGTLTVDSFLKSSLQTNSVELTLPHHLIPISSVHPLLVSSLQSADAGSNVTSTVTSVHTLPTPTENALRKRKPIKSIQEILDSQSTGTTYTTSYCSPIMAVQNHIPHDNTHHANTIQSSNLFPAPSTEPAPAVNTNSQLHALLNNTVSNPINSPSLHALLNNTISNSPTSSPSLHSLLNTVASPHPNASLNSLLNSVASSTPMPTTASPNAIPFFASVTSSSSPAAMLTTSRASSAGPPIFVGPDAITYPLLQSQAEILSQLKAGVLPTMSSSQVSSVLSALASDEACRLEMEADASQQELSASNASADKAPSLAHAEDSQLNDSMHDAADDATSDKSASKDSAEDTMIVQVMNMISSEERQNGANVLPSTNLLGVGSKHAGVKREAVRLNAPPMIFVKQEMLEAANQRGGFGRSGGATGFDAADGTTVAKAAAGGSSRAPRPPPPPPPAAREPPEASNFVERVSCYKCKFCPFLSLEEGDVSTHQRHHHSTQVADSVGPERRAKLKCPGCSNVFYSPTSLRVHLSQDHQVAGEGLNMMVSVVVGNSASLLRISKHKKTKRRDSAAVDTRLAVDMDTPDANTAVGSTIHLRGDELALVNAAIDGRGLPGDGRTLPGDGRTLPGDGRTLSGDSGVKIRVRNLDRETDLEHALHNDMVVCADVEVVDGFHDGGLPMDDEDDDEDLCSDGATGLDDGDLDRVLEEDLIGKQLKATIDPCEYKDVKSDLSSLVVCLSVAPPPDVDYDPPTPPPPPPAKRRGRPKGSRNQSRQLLLAMYLPTASGAVEVMPEKDSAYKCDIDGCAVRLKSHDNIEYHRRCHRGAGYVCPECSLETPHWSPLLLNHLWRVHCIDMELYSCAHCSYKCSSYCKLINVHQLIHGDARPFLCDTCGKGFKNPKQMRNHKVIHSLKRFKAPANGATAVATAGPTVAPGDCATCGRSFNTARLLRLHQDNVHRKLRPHLCNFCGYSASSRSTLKMHMRQHTGEKPFGCEECDYRTADHNSLRRHKMRHTGDKPYKCPHCTYACIQSSTFKAHLKSKHPGQDNGLMFSCPHCPFRSVKRDNLVAHMAEHEGGTTTTARTRSKEQQRSKDQQRAKEQQRAKAELQRSTKGEQQQRAKEQKQLAKEKQQQLAEEERQLAKATTQQQQGKKERQKKTIAQKSSQGISVVDINDIIVTEPQGSVTDMGVAGSLQLIYVSAETVGEFVKSRERSLMAAGGGSRRVDSGAADAVEMPPPAEALSPAEGREGGHTVADFEPEEITGDIRDIVTIPEPGELKFKVAPEQL